MEGSSFVANLQLIFYIFAFEMDTFSYKVMEELHGFRRFFQYVRVPRGCECKTVVAHW
jgi:hypothetical protein